jgi:hypothetical protein
MNNTARIRNNTLGVMTTGKAGGLNWEPLKAVIVSRLRQCLLSILRYPDYVVLAIPLRMG